MNAVTGKVIDPAIRRRNRITLIILLAMALAVAAGGVIYLRHYGFSTQETESRYH